MSKKDKILDLVLEYKWFDMIVSGEKKEEYRSLAWFVRITDEDGKLLYEKIRIRRGYTARAALYELLGYHIGVGRKSWGAPDGKVICLELGQRLE